MKQLRKGISGIASYQEVKTGQYCSKHSLRVRINQQCQYTEIIPLDKKIGPYYGPETEIINGKTGIYCIQCRKEEKIVTQVKKIQEKAQELKLEAKKGVRIKQTSGVLKTRSIMADETIRLATFESFQVIDDSTKKLKEKAYEFAKEILVNPSNIYLFAGGTGRGKSHLSMAILDFVNKESYRRSVTDRSQKPFKCVYISMPKLMTLINETYQMSWAEKETYPYTEAKMTQLIASSDVVVLDDLGAEAGTSSNGQVKATNSQRRILTELLNSRQGKATIISTNLTQKEVKDVYDERVSSRINKNRVSLVFDTSDKRGVI